LHLAYTIKIGLPLSEDWIASDRDRAADGLLLALYELGLRRRRYKRRREMLLQAERDSHQAD
jgi:hypothetical protein